jgi:hypothetical protein
VKVTVHIISRNDHDKKMVLLREKNGRLLAGISATGATTAKKASEYSFIKMEISMKASGRGTDDMDKALIGEMSMVNLDVNTLEIGSKTGNTEEELSSIRMEIVTTVIGSTACHKVRDV